MSRIDDIYIDGVSAKSVGIYLKRAFELSPPIPIDETIQVPGRNGAIIIGTGAYRNRSGVADCFALQTNVIEKINDVNRFLFSSKGYRRIEISGDTDHFILGRVANGARIAQRLHTLNPFEIEFDCKPQRFIKGGEAIMTFTVPGEFLNVYGFPAKPIIKVYGNGAGTVTITNTTVNILDMDDHIVLDCDTMDAYKGDLNQNHNIKAAEFPVLEAGVNTVSFTGGVTSVEITPRWWEL